MEENHKHEQLRRHLKGAARNARRKEREGYASRPDKEQPGRRGQARDEDGWEAPRKLRKKRKRPATKPHQERREELVQALVVGVARGHVQVCLGDERDARLASIAPSLRQSPLVVGDQVMLSPRDTPRVESLLPRRNLLSRPDVGNRHRELPIAANLDLGVIVAAYASPPLRPGLIDRYLIALERAGVEPLLCINKIDLCSDKHRFQELDELLAPYRELQLPIVYASAEGGAGTLQLLELLAGKTALLVGHSGVGKSSLLAALGARPASAISGAVRAYDGRGRHTTSASSLQHLPGNLRLIDTPGVRAFGLWGMTAAELSADFPGFEDLPRSCRFRDCSHSVEPGCAVLAALDSGRLARSRHGVYLRMLRELSG